MPFCDGTQSELIKNVKGLSISWCDETQRKFIKMLRGYQCQVVTRFNVDL